MIFTDSKGRRLEMSKRHQELQGMNDHDLLVQLHERMDNHLNDHQRSTSRVHWLSVSLLSALGLLATVGLIIK